MSVCLKVGSADSFLFQRFTLNHVKNPVITLGISAGSHDCRIAIITLQSGRLENSPMKLMRWPVKHGPSL